MRIGITELLVVVILAITLISPDKLKDYMATIKGAIKQVNDARAIITSEIEDSKKVAKDLTGATTDELRRRLISIAICFIIAFVAWYVASPRIVKIITEMGHANGYEMVYTAPQEILVQQLKIAGILGLITIIPIILYEVCAFILPAFDTNVKIVMIITCIAAMALFAGGTIFAVKGLLPFLYITLKDISGESGAVAMVTVESYINLYTSFCVWIGLIFEMPIATAILSKTGLLTADKMIKAFRPVIVLIFLIAAMLTPPDVVTQVILAIPMIGLYWISIGISRLTSQKVHMSQERGVAI